MLRARERNHVSDCLRRRRSKRGATTREQTLAFIVLATLAEFGRQSATNLYGGDKPSRLPDRPVGSAQRGASDRNTRKGDANEHPLVQAARSTRCNGHGRQGRDLDPKPHVGSHHHDPVLGGVAGCTPWRRRGDSARQTGSHRRRFYPDRAEVRSADDRLCHRPWARSASTPLRS